MIRAGELNRRIAIQQKTETPDSRGQMIATWADVTTVWCGVITTGGREFYAAQKLNTETSAVFKIRYTTVINSRMRIKWGTRYFEIINVNDVDGKHVEMLISAKEVV